MTINTITYNSSTSEFDKPDFTIPDPIHKTIFLIHGFMSNPNQAFGDLDQKLDKLYSGKANIVNVNWPSAAGTNKLAYPFVSSGLPRVARALAKTFGILRIDPTKTEIIGHSLGAHIAGFAGQEVKKQQSPINQIIGLDPAGVAYELTEADDRISADDAQRVVVIHSSNSATGGAFNDGFGLYHDAFNRGLGNLDIYIKQWGEVYGSAIGKRNDHGLATQVYERFVDREVFTGANQFGSNLNFNDFVNLEKLDDSNFTGNYTVNLDIKNPLGDNDDNQLPGDDSNNFLQGNGGNDSLVGFAGDDLIYGDDPVYKTVAADKRTNNDTLSGGAGNDLLLGGFGADYFNGGAGNDTLYGEQGIDTANYFDDFGATQGIYVSLMEGWATDSFGNQDTLSGIDNIIGSQNNDTIVGDDFSNTLDGFAGSDTLTGLGGADTFVLSFPGELTTETITDFSREQGDKITIAAGPSSVSLDQFAYNPGDGTLSFQGTPYAILSSLPQDFNIQTDIIIPPAPTPPPFTIGF